MSDKSMLALVADGAKGMTLARVEEPVPGPGEVLLEVAAAGVNRADLSQLAGHYPPPPGESDIVGLEAAGRVVALGAGVDTGFLGVTACALLAGGGYAQRVAVPADMLIPLPSGWSLAEAAGFPETAMTAYLNLFVEAGLQRGERVLVHGGASGVGTAAIRQAKLAGATVVTTAGGPAKVAACLSQGADLALDRHEGPWLDHVKRELGAVDVILDMVGGAYINRNIHTLALNGRLVQIAFGQGSKDNIDAAPLRAKRLTFTGSTLRPRSDEDKG